MTRDDIIAMAQEAGAHRSHDPELWDIWEIRDTGLERFASLVISHHVKESRPKPDSTQRKWLQAIAYQHGGIGDLCETELEFGAMVAAAERAACIEACNTVDLKGADECIAAIQARGSV